MPHTPENRAKNPLPEESGGQAKQRGRSLKTSSHHWTGGIGGDRKTTETERAATPARVGLNQHIQRLSHLAMPVLAVTNKADVHRTLAAGKRRAASRPKPNNFGAEGASTRNPGPTPLPDESGKVFFSSVDRPPTVIGIHAMQPERPLEPRKTCDHRFRPAQVGRQRCLECSKQPRLARSSRNLPQPPSSHRSSPSLFVKPRIDLRHQDRPKGKFPDLRFPGQPAQVAPS